MDLVILKKVADFEKKIDRILDLELKNRNTNLEIVRRLEVLNQSVMWLEENR